MSKNIISFVLVLSFYFSFLFAQDPNEILSKVWENSKVSDIKTLYAESTMKIMGMAIQTIRWHKDNKIRVDNLVMGQNTSIVITPTAGWINQGGVVQDFTDEQLEQTRKIVLAQNYASAMPYSKDDILQAELAGKEKINDRVCYNLKISLKGEDEPINVFVDQTNYEVRKVTVTQDIQGESKKVEMVFVDYENTDGYKFPKTIEISIDGENFATVENTTVTINKEIDDKLFQK
ncbi:MAG: hypothetical protein ACUVQ1_05235 [Candidatus Kapaibacteriales bacterium]